MTLQTRIVRLRKKQIPRIPYCVLESGLGVDSSGVLMFIKGYLEHKPDDVSVIRTVGNLVIFLSLCVIGLEVGIFTLLMRL